MLPELAPLPPLLHIQGQLGGPHLPKGPGPLGQGSLPVLGPRSPIHHLIRALLEIPLWICPLLRSSGDPYSTTTLLPKILIAVLGTCIVKFIMIFRPLLQSKAHRLYATSAEVLPGAIYDPMPVFLPPGGQGVLPHDDLYARAQSDCYSFHYRWSARDTSGHRYCSYVQSAGGPRQLGQLQTVAPSLHQGDGLFIILGYDSWVYLVQDAAPPEYAPYRSHSAV